MSELDETLSRLPRDSSVAAVGLGCLVNVIGGPDRGAQLSLHPSGAVPILLGKSPACDLRLSDPSVSRRHLSLVSGDHGILARDLGSTNGTWIGGVRITEAWVQPGETLHLGDTVVRVDAAGRPSSSSTTSRRCVVAASAAGTHAARHATKIQDAWVGIK